MFVVLLTFSENKAEAGRFMEGHKEWIARGFADGVFLMVGSIQPNAGGAILAHDTTRAEIEARVRDDPFVVENIVTAEIVEIAPSKMDERLNFVKAA